MSRVFLSHSSTNDREAIALRQWLAEQNPRLANEIFLDLDPNVGIRTGERWAAALQRANARCEAVVCLLSKDWETRVECLTEYRTAETLNKRVFCARLEADTGTKTSAWQWCDLFGDGPRTTIDVGDGEPVQFVTQGLYRLRDGIRGAGIGADSFVWPGDDPTRPPYRGWQSFLPVDAGIFFGRDAQIVKALDALRGMRKARITQWFVILGPSGAGKSSFLLAGLLPRLQRDDREFLTLGIVRPERDVLVGENGFAKAIYAARQAHSLTDPALGDIEKACTEQPEQIRPLLVELQRAAHRQLLERGDDAMPPTLVLPLDQAEELLSAEGETQAEAFLRLIRDLVAPAEGERLDVIIAASIRSDRFEGLQTRPELADVGIEAFAELKPMPIEQFKEVISGPAERATESGRPLQLSPELVSTILEDCKEGSDTLPLLSLTLSRLFEKYGSSKLLTLAHYEKLGGLRRVVQTVIDGILDRSPDIRRSQLESLRAGFIPWLVTINPVNDKPMRRVARWTDLPKTSWPLIDAFVANRLLVKDKCEGEEVAEVALESLLRQWEVLAGWLDDERENLRVTDDVERAAAAWKARGHDEAWLLAGSRLAAAEAVTRLPGYRELLTHADDFLTASRQRAQEGDGNQPVIRTAGFICVLVGVVALSIGLESALMPWFFAHKSPDWFDWLDYGGLSVVLLIVPGVQLLVRGRGRASPGATVWGCGLLAISAASALFSLWPVLRAFGYRVSGFLLLAGLVLLVATRWRAPPYRTMAIGYFIVAAAVLLLVVIDGRFVPVHVFDSAIDSDSSAVGCQGRVFDGNLSNFHCDDAVEAAEAALLIGGIVCVVLFGAGVIRALQAIKHRPL